MCTPQADLPDSDYVKLMHCPAHGTFHLSVSKATVHLTPRELLLLGAAINRWWQEHPEQAGNIKPFTSNPSSNRRAV